MFCYQCEQTAGGSGCTKIGVCGKNEDIQSLQDILLFGLKGVAAYAFHARELGGKDDEVDAFMHEALFKTVTNVDFNLNDYLEMVLRCGKINLKTMELLDKVQQAAAGSMMEIATVDISKPRQLTLTTKQNTQVKFDVANFQQQMRRLSAIMTWAAQRQKLVAAVDLTVARGVPVAFAN